MDARLNEIGRIFNDVLKEKCEPKKKNISGDFFLPPRYTVLGDGEGGIGSTLVINDGVLKSYIRLKNEESYFAQYENNKQITYSKGANMLGCSKFLDVFLKVFEDIAPEKLKQTALFPA